MAARPDSPETSSSSKPTRLPTFTGQQQRVPERSLTRNSSNAVPAIRSGASTAVTGEVRGRKDERPRSSGATGSGQDSDPKKNVNVVPQRTSTVMDQVPEVTSSIDGQSHGGSKNSTAQQESRPEIFIRHPTGFPGSAGDEPAEAGSSKTTQTGRRRRGSRVFPDFTLESGIENAYKERIAVDDAYKMPFFSEEGVQDPEEVAPPSPTKLKQREELPKVPQERRDSTTRTPHPDHDRTPKDPKVTREKERTRTRTSREADRESITSTGSTNLSVPVRPSLWRRKTQALRQVSVDEFPCQKDLVLILGDKTGPWDLRFGESKETPVDPSNQGSLGPLAGINTCL